MTKYIGILTAGGDSPGLNAAIRAIGKAACGAFSMQLIGFRDGFRGLMENRYMPLDMSALSGILAQGGTILGTSRDKPQRMPIGKKTLDMTDAMVSNYHKHNLDVLVCLGGGGTLKNAYHLSKHGINVIHLPKTIDNDIALTDVTFGFDTALGIATEAIDRLHSTAHSHHRIVVVEVMGHHAGWLTLGAGIGGGADVILIPEIPYDIESVAESIRERSRAGKRFSIIAIAEGAMSKQECAAFEKALSRKKQAKECGRGKRSAEALVQRLEAAHSDHTLRLARRLEKLTGLEARVTILGHLQRGGTPSAADRVLATRLGTACAELVQQGKFGVMVASRGDTTKPMPIAEVVGKRKLVPLDHSWLRSARLVGTSLGE